jgi:hypothetical protein
VKRIFLAAGFVLAVAAIVEAENTAKNLQFFSKNMSDPEIKAEMGTIKGSLGVNCAHCHQIKPERDMSVDTENKKVARSMLEMQKKLGEKCFTTDFMPGFRKVPQATCYMCHKGEKKPEYEPKNPDDEKKFNDAVKAGGKKKARCDDMKKLVEEINKNYFTWKDAPKATCWMCHRGKMEFKVKLPEGKGAVDDGEKKPDEPKDEKKPDEKKPDEKKPDEQKDGEK